ncbi:carbamoyltransferase HypF [Candidatus Desantisbacteria bacterium]|nr:carbamoyltransferase HypF [Candidatus Desantisbacteria bacterium]
MNKTVTIIVKGIVQGVGFRPFVYRLATGLALNGFVLNSSSGVIIEVEGEEKAVDIFLESLPRYAPPLSNIENIEVISHPSNNLKSFEIRESVEEKGRFVPVSPDIGICSDCLSEMLSPADRRYKYPFINCTNCGPRFTIIQDIPYDRRMTTMSKFSMCVDCANEYGDQSDRRYHAQPDACRECGPSIQLLRGNGVGAGPSACPIQQTTILLQQGNIIAIKGIGGFHLACDAANDAAVAELRKRKGREGNKPFAVMSLDLDKVKQYCEVNEKEAHLLTSSEKPIVLLKKLPNCLISADVAPKNNYLGVMLPYTPLHYLLLAEFHGCALVMTSGNVADQPLIKDNHEAIEKLKDIADYILVHNRDIHNRCDDSIISVLYSKESIIRRARGYAPLPIALKFNSRQILAVGAELKNTFCLTKDNYAFISQHIGDLKNYETLHYYKENIEHFKRLFRIEPEIIAHDLHPNYLSTRFAQEYHNLQPITYNLQPIQHHHAHIASCMAENGVDEKVIGVAMDGIGYGTDGNIWGCEFLLTDYSGFERMAHLKYIPMPGGDKATEQPWRMAISYLYSVYGEAIPSRFLKRWGDEKTLFIMKMLKQGLNSPLTSSAGRLFDAVSGILGLRDVVDYEAQAAIELEMIADGYENRGYGFEIREQREKENTLIIDPTKTILDIVHDIELDINPSIISARFHNTVIGWTLETCRRVRDKTGINKTALSGGVLQNRYLFERIKPGLEEQGFECFSHSRVPSNDGGISFGQAVIASRITVHGLQLSVYG